GSCPQLRVYPSTGKHGAELAARACGFANGPPTLIMTDCLALWARLSWSSRSLQRQSSKVKPPRIARSYDGIRMNQKEIKELIELLVEKDITEFELERGDMKLHVKRGSTTAPSVQVAPAVAAMPHVAVAAPASAHVAPVVTAATAPNAPASI